MKILRLITGLTTEKSTLKKHPICVPKALLFLLVWFPAVSFSQATTIYFYAPEVSTSRNSVLKNTFDEYLTSQGAFKLQPVAEKATFDELIQYRTKSIFILSNSHFNQNLDATTKYSLALRGVKNGKDTYYKMLLSRKDLLEKAPNSPITIASASSEDQSLNTLREMLPQLFVNNSENIKILTVPKAIDALMAVGFGLSQGALASEESLNKLSSLYKNQYQQLKVLAKSKPIKRLVVITAKQPSNNQEQALQALSDMDRDPIGKLGLGLLGLDGWLEINNMEAK